MQYRLGFDFTGLNQPICFNNDEYLTKSLNTIILLLTFNKNICTFDPKHL